MSKYLSKSSYMAGRECKRKLWQLLWDRKNASPYDGMTELNFEFGSRFGELAHNLYPNGVLIDIDRYNLDKAVKDTCKAIESGTDVIMEAAFCHEQYRVLSDIVEKQPDGRWHLIEVKSATSVKDSHYPDLAYQKWVMEKNGHSVSRCSIIHADKNGRWPDANSIFKIVDVTDAVDTALLHIDSDIEAMRPIMTKGEKAPNARDCYSKKNCIQNKCEYRKTVCWKNINEITIYDLIHASKIPLLESMGVFYVSDIPDDFEMSDKITSDVNRIKKQAVDIDTVAITARLDELSYPIYFLDFESVSVPVPLFDGNKPWEKLAFQYSLHIMDKDGAVTHKEFLHNDASDPSKNITEALIRDIGNAGSIVVYHAGMEKGVLQDLKIKYPDNALELQSMIDRLWDLELVFKYDYRHWKFGNKSSIKVVLPTLLPNRTDLSYVEQEIQEGGSASISWVRLIETNTPETKRKIANDLKEYCKLDTLAMVELVNFLTDL